MQIKLQELLDAGVITPDVAASIRAYYAAKSPPSHNRLLLVFGILGAILAGLGIILIIAHNWDNFSRVTKTGFAFVPLVLGQAVAAYALLRRTESAAWKEGSGAFLFFAIGACLALISQVYHIDGDLSVFMFTWLLLSFLIVYVLKSSVASALFIVGSTALGILDTFSDPIDLHGYRYWLLVALLAPYYTYLIRQKPEANATRIHHWLIPLSLVFGLATVADRNHDLLPFTYAAMFSLMYLFGGFAPGGQRLIHGNASRITGGFGLVWILLNLSFDDPWQGVEARELFALSPELAAFVVMTILAFSLLLHKVRMRDPGTIEPFEVLFLPLVVLCILVDFVAGFAHIIVNVVVLAAGILTIRNGARQNHLGILNLGMLIIAALSVCRFFDTDISFVLRGVLFLCVGLGFFAANYLMLQRRKRNEQ